MKIGNWLYHIQKLFTQEHYGKHNLCDKLFCLQPFHRQAHACVQNIQSVCCLSVGADFLVMGHICWLERCNVCLLVSRLAGCPQPLLLVTTTVSLWHSLIFYDFWCAGSPSRLTPVLSSESLLLNLWFPSLMEKQVPFFKNIFKSPLSEAVGTTPRF